MAEVGDPEPCDWCGRPGTVEQFSSWIGDTLEWRDPALCPVCLFWFSPPSVVLDAMEDGGVDETDIMLLFEDELRQAWLRKVAEGKRAPQADGERSGALITQTFTYRPMTSGRRDDGSEAVRLEGPPDISAYVANEWRQRAGVDPQDLLTKGTAPFVVRSVRQLSQRWRVTSHVTGSSYEIDASDSAVARQAWLDHVVATDVSLYRRRPG